jgi:hypothetical protein
MLAALTRADTAASTLEAAASAAGGGVSWTLLAAIGIRESGFQNINQIDGPAVGVFQIDPTQNPAVPASVSGSLSAAADWVAAYLAGNAASLASSFPNLSNMNLAGYSGSGNMSIIALADTYNLGLGGVKQFLNNGFDPDLGTAGENYGQNVLQLTKCFH